MLRLAQTLQFGADQPVADAIVFNSQRLEGLVGDPSETHVAIEQDNRPIYPDDLLKQDQRVVYGRIGMLLNHHEAVITEYQRPFRSYSLTVPAGEAAIRMTDGILLLRNEDDRSRTKCRMTLAQTLRYRRGQVVARRNDTKKIRFRFSHPRSPIPNGVQHSEKTELLSQPNQVLKWHSEWEVVSDKRHISSQQRPNGGIWGGS